MRPCRPSRKRTRPNRRPPGNLDPRARNGALAQAYNALGEHARAREACEQALAWLTEEDLDFCVVNLGILLELSRAQAGLGDLSGAAQRLDALIERHRA